MRGPLSTIAICVILMLGAVGYGVWERHVGAQAERARATADSLLKASQTRQDSILRADSLATERGRMVRDSLNVRLRALQRDYGASRKRSDSLIAAVGNGPTVPRDTVLALVAAFQGERAKADSQIATLAADTLFLVGQIARKDSVIQGLTASLATARAGWAAALKPSHPGLLAHVADLTEKVLAVRGGIAFLLGK